MGEGRGFEMNKEEAKQKLHNLAFAKLNTKPDDLKLADVMRIVNQIYEPQKPVVPQFVAEIIEYYKRNNATLYDALGEKNFNKQYSEWLLNEQNAYDKVAKAWIFGYEVEREKRYLVKMKNIHSYSSTLKHDNITGEYFFGNEVQMCASSSAHTRKELEEAGFGWVFDCEGVEVEEVEE